MSEKKMSESEKAYHLLSVLNEEFKRKQQDHFGREWDFNVIKNRFSSTPNDDNYQALIKSAQELYVTWRDMQDVTHRIEECKKVAYR